MKTFNSIQPTVYFVFVFIIVIGFFYYSKLLIYKEGLASIIEVPDVKFPFKNIKDENGNKLNIIAISAPFREEADEKTYDELKEKGLHFLGISSYSEFPEKLSNPHESRFHEERNHNYLSMVSTWAHCFREPSVNLKLSGLPLILMTEADLKNTELSCYTHPFLDKRKSKYRLILSKLFRKSRTITVIMPPKYKMKDKNPGAKIPWLSTNG
jgi:hypothetical protein